MTTNEGSVRNMDTFNWVGSWSFSENTWTRKAKPHTGHYQSPIWEGKSYAANYYFKEKGGWSGDVRSKVKVKSWETVTVPAGTFEALKIVQGNEHYRYTSWYVPEIKYHVKWISNSRSKGKRSGELMEIKMP